MCIYEKLVNRFRRSKIKHPVPKELFNNFDEREIDHVAPPAPGSGFEVSNLVHSSNSDAKSILFETSIPVIQSQVQSQEDEVKQELYFDYEDDFIYSITLITPSLSVMITASEDWTSRFQKSFRYSIFDIQHNFPSTPEGEFYYYW
ncbi:uncharacterized protein L201_003191 [Kwoniella dendrophila CBS 6074]|uniref:Uncharacterized protein n=1 Tax=Kwoniella dendrophila CBS 6074 TaxID=1295534 RepID=A0AAX4JTZ1_9TREE